MFREPQPLQAIALTVAGAILLGINASFPAPALLYPAVAFVAFGVALFIWIALDVWVDIYGRYNEASKISTRAVELEKAARLTDAQAQAVPAIAYTAALGMSIGRNGEWSYLVITKDGIVPFEWAQNFLLECNAERLRSIRSYPNGTQQQHYAQWLTAWLREQRLAVGGEELSGKSAEWIDANAYWNARKMFRIPTDAAFSNVSGMYTMEDEAA